MIGAEIVGGVDSFALSGAPNEVCRRNNDPKTRLFFDSSDVLDANEPVLWKWAIYFWAICFTKGIFLERKLFVVNSFEENFLNCCQFFLYKKSIPNQISN